MNIRDVYSSKILNDPEHIASEMIQCREFGDKEVVIIETNHRDFMRLVASYPNEEIDESDFFIEKTIDVYFKQQILEFDYRPRTYTYEVPYRGQPEGDNINRHSFYDLTKAYYFMKNSFSHFRVPFSVGINGDGKVDFHPGNARYRCMYFLPRDKPLKLLITDFEQNKDLVNYFDSRFKFKWGRLSDLSAPEILYYFRLNEFKYTNVCFGSDLGFAIIEQQQSLPEWQEEYTIEFNGTEFRVNGFLIAHEQEGQFKYVARSL